MTQNKKKHGGEFITITYDPKFAKRLRADEMEKEKDASYLVIYQQGESDSTGDKIYHVWLYKQVWYAPIRQEENLAEVLDFVAKNKSVQILNADAYEEKKEGTK